LPGEIQSKTNETSLKPLGIVNQLPEPETRALPIIKGVDGSIDESEPVRKIGTTPVPQQYQLPKEILSQEQQLNLLRERFLKGEVKEETYHKLRTEIEDKIEKNSVKNNTQKEQLLITDQYQMAESQQIQSPQIQPTTKVQQYPSNNEKE
jgi:hypothetical protein